MKEATTEPRDPSRPLKNRAWEAIVQVAFKEPHRDLCEICHEKAGCKEGSASKKYATRLGKNVLFQARLAWLQKQTEAESVLTVLQRKELLSKIASTVGNAQICDYVEAAGGQGAYVTYGPDSPRQGAVKKLKTATIQDEDGNGATITTEIELHSPSVAIAAIRELNEMEGAHAPAKVAQTDTKGNDVVPMVLGPVCPVSVAEWSKQYAELEKAREKMKKGG